MRRYAIKIRRNDEGSSLIEAALVLPILVLLLVGAIDMGRMFYVAIEVSSAAQAGAMYGIRNLSDTAGMIAAARSDAADVATIIPTAIYGCECSDGSHDTVSCTSAPTGCGYNVVNYVQVNTLATYIPILPYPGLSNSVVLRGKARLRAAQ